MSFIGNLIPGLPTGSEITPSRYKRERWSKANYQGPYKKLVEECQKKHRIAKCFSWAQKLNQSGDYPNIKASWNEEKKTCQIQLRTLPFNGAPPPM